MQAPEEFWLVLQLGSSFLCSLLGLGSRFALFFRGELLFDLGVDGTHVHLIDLGGFFQRPAIVARGLRRVENDNLYQEPS